MCKACTAAYAANGPFNPNGPTEEQRALFLKAKTISDPRKLQALAPGWYKAHVRAARLERGCEPWGDPIASLMRRFCAPVGDDLRTVKDFAGLPDDPRAYVKAWDERRKLRPAAMTWDRPPLKIAA